jgi:hypothetical protein
MPNFARLKQGCPAKINGVRVAGERLVEDLWRYKKQS